MRNLKRALSLTLASVMLLGMMVVGSSAVSYPDVDENDNVEAIEVIQAVGVMVGDENGNFSPDSQVTRAQMAVIMAKLMNLGGYIPGSNPFSDVPEWAQASVSACYTRGIVSGYGNGLYGANDPVTAVQAASMLMRALGYFQYAEDYKDGFETATVRQAGKIDLFNGIGDANAKTELTRNQVAQMVLNTLQSGTVEPDDSGKVNVNVGGAQVSVGATNYVYITSRDAYAKAINDAEAGSSSGITGYTGYIVDLGEKLYQGDLRKFSGSADDFNRPATTWEYKTIEVGTYTDGETYTYTKGVSEKDLYNRVGSIAMAYNWSVYHNGQQLGGNELKPVKSSTGTWSRTATGTLTQVYVMPDPSSNSGTVVVSMIDTMLAEVIRVNNDNFTVSYLSPTAGTNIRAPQTLIEAEDTGLKAGDRLLVRLYEDGSRFSVYDYAVAETVAGEVTAVKARYDVSNVDGSWAKIGDTQYDYVGSTFAKDLADTRLDNPTVNSQNTLYLDYYDNMIAFEATERSVNYLFVEAAIHDLNSGKAAAVFPDGTKENINVTEYTYVTGYTTTSGVRDYTTRLVKNADVGAAITSGNMPKGIYEYTKSGSSYHLVQVPDRNSTITPPSTTDTAINVWTNMSADKWGDEGFSTTTDAVNPNKVGITAATTAAGYARASKAISYSIRKGNNSIQAAYSTAVGGNAELTENVVSLTTSTIFVDVAGGKVYNGYAEVPTMTDIDFYVVYNRGLNADVVFITRGADNSTSDNYFFVTDTKPVYTEDNNKFYEYDAYVNGVKEKVIMRGTNLDNRNLPAAQREIHKNALYKIVKITPDNYVTEAQLVFDFCNAHYGLTGWNQGQSGSTASYAEWSDGVLLRVIERLDSNSNALLSGAKNNVVTNNNSQRNYKWTNDSVFMEIRLKSDGTVDSVQPSSVTAINTSTDNEAGYDNVYVFTVDDKDARTPVASLVFMVTRSTASDVPGWTPGQANMGQFSSVAEVNAALKEGNVVIGGDWQPLKTSSTLVEQLVIPMNRTLEIQGSFNADTYNVKIAGIDPNTSTLIVKKSATDTTSTLSTIRGGNAHDITFIVDAANFSYSSGNNGPHTIEAAVTVTNNLHLTSAGAATITVNKNMTVGDSITRDAQTKSLIVNATLTVGNTVMGTGTIGTGTQTISVTVNTPSSLHVGDTLYGDLTLGGTTSRGYATLGSHKNGALIFANKGGDVEIKDELASTAIQVKNLENGTTNEIRMGADATRDDDLAASMKDAKDDSQVPDAEVKNATFVVAGTATTESQSDATAAVATINGKAPETPATYENIKSTSTLIAGVGAMPTKVNGLTSSVATTVTTPAQENLTDGMKTYADAMVAWKARIMAAIGAQPGLYTIDEATTRAFNWQQMNSTLASEYGSHEHYVTTDGKVYLSGWNLDDGSNSNKPAGKGRLVISYAGKDQATLTITPKATAGAVTPVGEPSPINITLSGNSTTGVYVAASGLDDGSEYTWTIKVGKTIVNSGSFKWVEYPGFTTTVS